MGFGKWDLAAHQFNGGQFWVCHETLEVPWQDATEPLKTLLQGIIQVAAGCHHLTQGNLKGTLSLLEQGLDKLKQAPHECPEGALWIDMETFVRQTNALWTHVQQHGLTPPLPPMPVWQSTGA
jgi:hypothetical protein